MESEMEPEMVTGTGMAKEPMTESQWDQPTVALTGSPMESVSEVLKDALKELMKEWRKESLMGPSKESMRGTPMELV
jgi:hypothetical protein